MDAWVYVVGAIVAVAIVYFAFVRKPPELPQTSGEPNKLTAPEEAERAAQKTKQLAPASKPAAERPVERAVERTESAEMAPEPLGSSDVLPPSNRPAKALSKKDVAGIRKGLAATRGGF